MIKRRDKSSDNASKRESNKAKNQKTSDDGLMGLAVGTTVPMKIFDTDYATTDYKHQVGTVDANEMTKATKKALSGSKKQFMGLGGSI